MNTIIKSAFILFLAAYAGTVYAQGSPAEIQAQLKNLSPSEIKKAIKTAQTQGEAQIQEVKQEAQQNAKEKVATAEKKVEQNVTSGIQQNVQEGVAAGKTEKEALADAVIAAKNEKPLPVSPIYGHHLYRLRNITAISDGVNVKAPDSYVLGVGDEISVNVWGRAEFSGSQKINEDGYIKFFQMPRLYLKGVTYKQAQQKVIGQFKQSYNLETSQIAVALNYSRTITVNVVGEVMQPRSYTISAINTAVNALAAADGPTDIGSVRNIRISSAGKADRTLDLYKFLLNPLSSEEFFITNNDYIYVPPVGKVVNIQGAVKRPFQYELLASENLKSLLQWSGGLSANAFKANIQVFRFENDKTRTITINYNDLEKNGTDFTLMPGDILIVPSIDGGTNEIAKTVEIVGAVNRPGKYDLLLNEGLRVLVGRAGGFAVNAYTGNFQVKRIENNEMKLYDVSLKKLDSLKTDFFLVKGDVVTVSTIDPDYFTDYANISGAVKLPGRYQVEKGKTKLTEFLAKAELKDDANTPLIYLSRLQNDLSRLYYRINLDDVLKNPASKDNLVLQSKDEIFIVSKSNFRDAQSISIYGAVRNPNVQTLTTNTTLRDVIFRAGGLLPEADRSRVEISRTENKDGVLANVVIKSMVLAPTDTLYIQDDVVGNFQLQPYDQVMVRKKPNSDPLFNVTLNGEVKYPGVYAIKSKKETITDIIKRAGGLTESAFPEDATFIRTEGNVGFVVLDLGKAIKQPSSPFNYTVKAGDVITIPIARELVSVEGAVDFPEIDIVKRVSMSYRAGESLRYYVDEYAGGTSKEKRGKYYLTQVRYPNGSVRKTKSYFFNTIKSYPPIKPGAIIIVGAKPLEKDANGNEKAKTKVDWEEVASKALGGITAVFTLILLTQSVAGTGR
jgi:polysaccharide biosynthesis/export protein